MLDSLLIASLAVALIMLITWLIAIKKDNPAIVDLAWTSCVVLTAGYYAWSHAELTSAYKMLALAFAIVWGGRLLLHLSSRLYREKRDPRYEALKLKLGPVSKLAWLGFFQIQGISVILLALPFALIFSRDGSVGAFNLLGCLIVFMAIVGEAIADRQLEIFKSDDSNRGRVCDVGLWAYSRHPNYFCEWLFWLGLSLMAYGANYWYLGLISPVLMYHFIVNVTGIPPAEERAIATKGERYRQYMKHTPAFFPSFLKSRNKETI